MATNRTLGLSAEAVEGIPAISKPAKAKVHRIVFLFGGFGVVARMPGSTVDRDSLAARHPRFLETVDQPYATDLPDAIRQTNYQAGSPWPVAAGITTNESGPAVGAGRQTGPKVQPFWAGRRSCEPLLDSVIGRWRLSSSWPVGQ